MRKKLKELEEEYCVQEENDEAIPVEKVIEEELVDNENEKQDEGQEQEQQQEAITEYEEQEIQQQEEDQRDGENVEQGDCEDGDRVADEGQELEPVSIPEENFQQDIQEIVAVEQDMQDSAAPTEDLENNTDSRTNDTSEQIE